MNARERRVAGRASLALYLERSMHGRNVATVKARHPFTAKWTPAQVCACSTDRPGMVGVRFIGQQENRSRFVSIHEVRLLALPTPSQEGQP